MNHTRRLRLWLLGAFGPVALAAGLAGCGATVGDTLPARIGGLSADAPARPAGPPVFPAVHDMPPPRDATKLSGDQIKQAEQELNALRDRQAGSSSQAQQEKRGRQ